MLMALLVGGAVLALSFGFGDDIVRFANNQQSNAASEGVEWLGTLIMGPVKFAFDPDSRPFGAILAAIVWPVTLFWPILVLLHILIVEAVGFTSQQDLPG
jgi:hypothetical protein